MSKLLDALVLLRAIDDPQGIALALNGPAELASLTGDYGEAPALLGESQRLLAAAGSAQDRVWIHCLQRGRSVRDKIKEVSSCLHRFQEWIPTSNTLKFGAIFMVRWQR